MNYNDPALYYQINCMACKTVKIVETTKNTVRLDDFEENKKYDIQVKVGAKGVGLYDVAASLSFKTLGEDLMRLVSLFFKYRLRDQR